MSGPYRILYHHRIRANDGQAVHVREMIAALRAAGHLVHECALVPKSQAASHAPHPGRSLWQQLSLPRVLTELLERLYNRRGRAMLRQAIAEFRPHFVYERHALHCTAGLDAARQAGVPLLLEVNSPMVEEMQALGKLRFPRAAAAAERAVLAGADAVLPVTGVLAQMLQQRGADRARCHVIGNGVQLQRYGADAHKAAAQLRAQWQLPAGAFVLAFVGYMRPWHRLDLVLAAMRRQSLSHLHLLLLGEGPALGEIQQQAARDGLAARVRSLGVVPAASLPEHLLAADAALVPAINVYASPLKLFDAFAAALPTLAPDQANLREYMQDGVNGLLFTPGDEADLARQLTRLVQDRALAQRLGLAGRAQLQAQDWTWAGSANRVIAVYEALARSRA